jgi:hypothetical protein
MEENGWLRAVGPKWMLEHLRAQASPRKLRLFACASLRRFEAKAGPAFHDALEVGEAFAEGRATHEATIAACRAAVAESHGTAPADALRRALEHLASGSDWDAAHAYVHLVGMSNAPDARRADLAAQRELLRCLFGNPFRPGRMQAAWLAHNDSAALHLARTIDADQRFAELPVLADALEEAGCADAGLLGHCRCGGPHARGCWALDLLLARG